MKIAVIAGDSISLVLIQEQVPALGHTLCGWAATFEDALELLSQCAADLVIFDPYFDSAVVDPKGLEQILSLAGSPLVLMGVDPDRDLKLIAALAPLATIGAPPSNEELGAALIACAEALPPAP